MFLNTQDGFVTINSFRNTGISNGGDIIEFCKDVQNGKTANFTFHEEPQYYINALSDGALLEGLEQEIIELVISQIEEARQSV